MVRSMDDSILLNISTTVVENKNLLYQLNNQTTLKQDISDVQTINISQPSNLLFYENYLIIDNSLYNQNIPFNMIQYVMFKNQDNLFNKFGENKVITLEIMLFNGSNIILEFPEHDQNTAHQVYNTIIPRLNNQNFNQNYASGDNVEFQQNYNVNNQNSYNNQPTFPNNYQTIPKEKSVLIAIILHLFLTGLGYAYVDKWDKFIITFVATWICIFLTFLIIPIFIALGIWLYSLIDTIKMVERYNRGEII